MTDPVAAELRKVSVLQEVMQDDIKKVLEILAANQSTIGLIPTMNQRISAMQSDISTIKAAIADTNHDLRSVAKHTEKLEAFADDVADLSVRMTLIEQAA
jgi:predicted  nucleic acid-binding Zn-ribbon protein